MGGEEFIAIVQNVSHEHLQVVCEEVRIAIKKLEIPHRNSLVHSIVTISIGAALTLPVKNINKRDLIKAADESLYKVKEIERNGIHITTLKK